MCYYTLETYNACTEPDHHHEKLWLVKHCIIFHANKVHCPDIQYEPTLDAIPCPICHDEASACEEQIGVLSSPGPEFVGEFSMDVQIAHMKAIFDRRREE
ncbi:Vacuolar protein sorting-associated protein 74 [Venturia inaequalis]|nr:Vacuolar protein sorting-associated protein 74 [Venturia inaequalis]